MAYQKWTQAHEDELLRLAIGACGGEFVEQAMVECFEIENSLNDRPCITYIGGKKHGKVIYSIYPGHKEVLNKRECMLYLLPALRRHMILEHLANL